MRRQRKSDLQFESSRARFEAAAIDWYFWYQFWLYLHYLVGLSIVVLTAFAAAGADLDEIYSILAGVLAAVSTFLKPSDKASLFRTRWQLLNEQLLNPSKVDEQILFRVYVKAEALT